MTPEGKVKAKCKEVLKDEGAWWYMPVQNGMGRVGIPDIIACIPVVITPDMVGDVVGVFAGIETKAPGKGRATTANQELNLKDIGDAHGMAVVVDDPELLKRDIETLRGGSPVIRIPALERKHGAVV